jgi:UDP-N-acetylmuramate--alanine ligase
MKGVGVEIGTIHFVGIGGIGMSGIAEVMHNMGYAVQGRTWRKAMSSKGCARGAFR